MIDPDEVVGAATAADAVDDWIEGTDLELINVAVSDERATVTIAGSDPALDVDQLASPLQSTLGRPVDVTIKVVPTEINEFEAAN